MKELAVGTTHRGRILAGTICEDPLFIASSAFLLEDGEGNLVEVAVYNIPGAGWEVTERLFYKGRTLAIQEPCYKVRQDGSLGIRVDDPSEKSLRPAQPPSCKEVLAER